MLGILRPRPLVLFAGKRVEDAGVVARLGEPEVAPLDEVVVGQLDVLLAALALGPESGAVR